MMVVQSIEFLATNCFVIHQIYQIFIDPTIYYQDNSQMTFFLVESVVIDHVFVLKRPFM